MKKRKKVWLPVAVVCGVAVLVCAAVLVLSRQEVRLELAQETVPVGSQQVLCRLVNPTLGTVKYGETFYLERQSGQDWQRVNERDYVINFQLGQLELWPLGRREISFTVGVYSPMEKVGQYRIALPVIVEEEDQMLYAYFSLTDQ